MGMCSTLVSMRVVDDPRVGQCFDTRGSVFFYNTFGTSPQRVVEKWLCNLRTTCPRVIWRGVADGTRLWLSAIRPCLPWSRLAVVSCAWRRSHRFFCRVRQRSVGHAWVVAIGLWYSWAWLFSWVKLNDGLIDCELGDDCILKIGVFAIEGAVRVIERKDDVPNLLLSEHEGYFSWHGYSPE